VSELSSDLAMMEGLIKLAVKYGCRCLKLDNLIVEMPDGPPRLIQTANSVSAADRPGFIEVDPNKPNPEENCACGHLFIEHVEGGCLNGCNVELCAQTEEPK